VQQAATETTARHPPFCRFRFRFSFEGANILNHPFRRAGLEPGRPRGACTRSRAVDPETEVAVSHAVYAACHRTESTTWGWGTTRRVKDERRRDLATSVLGRWRAMAAGGTKKAAPRLKRDNGCRASSSGDEELERLEAAFWRQQATGLVDGSQRMTTVWNSRRDLLACSPACSLFDGVRCIISWEN
jgi:hypothetical protein